MKNCAGQRVSRPGLLRLAALLPLLILSAVVAAPVRAQAGSLSLDVLVAPTSVFRNQGGVVRFALNFFTEFESLEELFAHIDREAGRWRFESESERKAFAEDLLRRGVESRVVSMTYPAPHEVLVTHTRDGLAEAVMRVETSSAPLIYRGEHWSLSADEYRDVLLRLQERWKSSLNCWSAAASVAERVLSNWYIIREGISLFGAEYDSTEHFWQAVKYHPEVDLEDLSEVLERVRGVSWEPWLERLAGDQEVYLAHTYAVEFLRHNLTHRLQFFEDRLTQYRRTLNGPVRALQQRSSEEPWRLRFTALDEKIFWGDLADVFHLIHYFAQLGDGRFGSPGLEPALAALRNHRFDAIYLPEYHDGAVGFISPEFRRLMLEIWKVKFVEMARFREVIRSTQGYRLLHFLNDGNSPDIPIPVYVGFLEEIRELALRQGSSESP